MRSQLLSRTLLQATAALSVFCLTSALSAQDLVWVRDAGAWDNVQAVLNAAITSDVTGGNVTEGDELAGVDFTGVQSAQYYNGFAAGGAGAAGAGDGGAGFCDVYSYAASLAELNPDEQSLVSWSAIHNQLANSALEGGGGGGSTSVAGGAGGIAGTSTMDNTLTTSINCPVTLTVTPTGNPLATVPGTFEVSFAWAHAIVPDADNPLNTPVWWDRQVLVNATLPEAWILVWGGGGAAQMQAIYQTNDPLPGGSTDQVVVNSNGFSNGVAGDLFVGRGECVDNNLADGAQAWFSAQMASIVVSGAPGTFSGATAVGGFGATQTSTGDTPGDGTGAAGGSAGVGGYSGGSGERCTYDTSGMFEGWVGIFADW